MRGSRIVWIAALFALLLTGCFGGGGKPGNKPGGSAAPKTYTVSGTIKAEGGAGIKDVALSFSGMTETVKTDADGKWTSPALEGSVTVTPVHDDYTFDPKTRSVTKAATDVDFTGLEPKPPYAASGTIKDANDDPIEGVTVGFGDDADPVKTDEDGKWSQTGLLGAVVVTPTHDKYVFTPESREMTEGATDVDFTGMKKFTMSGLVLDEKDAPISGAKISFFLDGETEPNGSVLTDKDGKWIISGLFGTVTVTAEHRSYEFTPESITISGDDEVLDEFEFTGELQACDSGDSTKSDDPCVMSLIEQLQMMNTNLSGHYALGAHIDASATEHWNDGKGFVPIGRLIGDPEDEQAHRGDPFTGSFDGRGFEIRDIYIDRYEGEGPTTRGTGLFGFVGKVSENHMGVIDNVHLVGGEIHGNDYVAALVGFNEGRIANSSSFAKVFGLKQVGGLAGENEGTIEASHNRGYIEGNNWVGGLVGTNNGQGKAVIRNSYNAGEVYFNDTLGEDDAGFGGIAGANAGTIRYSYNEGLITAEAGMGVAGVIGVLFFGQVDGSYNVGDVDGGNSVGGVVGGNMGGHIHTSYNLGSVKGVKSVGGVVGENGEDGTARYVFNAGGISGNEDVGAIVGRGSADDSYFDKQTSGVTTSAAGYGKSTDEMKQQATYNNWDFADTWEIEEGRDYPDLINNGR